jgi:hypothetical protein
MGRREVIMTRQQIEDLFDGIALLECSGVLYEYIGTDENGLHLFRSVNNGYCIKSSYKNLFVMPEYDIKY